MTTTRRALLVMSAIVAMSAPSDLGATYILTKRGSHCWAFRPNTDPRHCLITSSTSMPRIAVLNYDSGVLEEFDSPIINSLSMNWQSMTVASVPASSMVPKTLFDVGSPMVFQSGIGPVRAVVYGAGLPLASVTYDDKDYGLTTTVLPIAQTVYLVNGHIEALPSNSYWPGI